MFFFEKNFYPNKTPNKNYLSVFSCIQGGQTNGHTKLNNEFTIQNIYNIYNIIKIMALIVLAFEGNPFPNTRFFHFQGPHVIYIFFIKNNTNKFLSSRISFIEQKKNEKTFMKCMKIKL